MRLANQMDQAAASVAITNPSENFGGFRVVAEFSFQDEEPTQSLPRPSIEKPEVSGPPVAVIDLVDSPTSKKAGGSRARDKVGFEYNEH